MSWSNPLSLALIALAWLFYHVIYGPPLCTCAVQARTFAKLEDRMFVCSSSVSSLTSSPVDTLACARACRDQPDCPSFVFDISSGDTTASGRKVGTCSWCPASNIIAMNYTADNPTLEVWLNVLGRVANPPTDTCLAIPGALSLGRLVTVRGRVPDVLPERILMDIYANDMKDIAVRVSPRFSYRGHINRLSLSYKANSIWKVKVRDEDFPFAAGRDFEVGVLAAADGFHIYIDGVFMYHIPESAFMIGDIGCISIRYADVYAIWF